VHSAVCGFAVVERLLHFSGQTTIVEPSGWERDTVPAASTNQFGLAELIGAPA
jgi:hypothetical protein